MVAGREATPKDAQATERLMKYWAEGEGAAKIRWGEPKDFYRCEAELGKYVSPGEVKGLCANLHHRALGVWPGQEDGGRGHGKVKAAMADLVTVPNRELMKVGKWAVHKGGEFNVTPELIQSAISAHNAGVLRKPVIRLGHEDPETGDPAVGWVDNVRASDDGQTLYGDLVGVPRKLAEIMPSAYPSLSIEGMHGYLAPDGTPHDFVLTGLGLLGAKAPGISSLKSVQELYDIGDEAIAAAIGEIGGTPVKFTVVQAATAAAEKKGAIVASLPPEVARRLGIEADADDETLKKALDEKLPEAPAAPTDAPPAPEPAAEPTPAPEPVAAAATPTSVDQIKAMAVQNGLTVMDTNVLAQLQVQAAAGEAARTQQLHESDERSIMDALKAGKIAAASAPKFRENLAKGGETRETTLTLLEALPENRAMAVIEAGHGIANESSGFDAELNQVSARSGVPVGKDA